MRLYTFLYVLRRIRVCSTHSILVGGMIYTSLYGIRRIIRF